MRALIFFALIFKFQTVISQEILTVEKTAKDMYISSKQWVATNFNSANSVIQVDIPNEKLLVKGLKKTIVYSTINNKSMPVDYAFDIIITLDFKENKCRINVQSSEVFQDLSPERVSEYVDSLIKATPGGGMLGKKFREEMKSNTISLHKQKEEIVKKEVDSILKSLRSAITKSDVW
jgi:hypothetical protein